MKAKLAIAAIAGLACVATIAAIAYATSPRAMSATEFCRTRMGLDTLRTQPETWRACNQLAIMQAAGLVAK